PRSWTMLYADLIGVLDQLPSEIPEDILKSLNEKNTEDKIPKNFIDKSPCPEIKSKLNNYKFLDAQELLVQEIAFTIKKEIIPRIEKKVG
ncbi:MAG: hypothetical protein ACTSVI_04450, partial [Promethearchaeota archaeon]